MDDLEVFFTLIMALFIEFLNFSEDKYQKVGILGQ
tara:strand:- start:340 stop:444 length:105 start_codon:yes stop_codon:yes gene_type:complete